MYQMLGVFAGFERPIIVERIAKELGSACGAAWNYVEGMDGDLNS